MPFKLRKAPKRDLYWVVNKETGKKHSKDPLPKERALAQMRALYASEDDMTGGIKRSDRDEYNRRARAGTWLLDENGYILTDTATVKQDMYDLLDYLEQDGVLTDEDRLTLQPYILNVRESLMTANTKEEVKLLVKRWDRFHKRGFDKLHTEEDEAPQKRPPPPKPNRQKRPKTPPRPARPEDDRDNDGKKDVREYVDDAPKPALAIRVPTINQAPQGSPNPQGSPASPLSPTENPSPKISQAELDAIRKKGKGKGGAIHKSLLQQIAQSAYSGKTRKEVGSYKLLYATPTLKFYKNPTENLIIVSIRGTADVADLDADIRGLTGTLRSSERWKKDRATMEFVQKNYPRPQYRYIAVGHSLGGAILDLMLRDGLISSGLSYNPYVEPQEMGGNPLHLRIYHKDDPLYIWFGHKVPNTEVRGGPTDFLKSIFSAPFGVLFNMYEKHRLGAFKGGSIQSNFRKQLMEVGISPEDYLEEVKKSARRNGYDTKTIAFSDNRTHKIRMERPDGKIIRFGRVGYNDFHIWSHLERNNQVSKGTAKGKQDRFLKSHSKIKGNWKEDKYSPNWLSMNLLW